MSSSRTDTLLGLVIVCYLSYKLRFALGQRLHTELGSLILISKDVQSSLIAMLDVVGSPFIFSSLHTLYSSLTAVDTFDCKCEFKFRVGETTLVEFLSSQQTCLAGLVDTINIGIAIHTQLFPFFIVPHSTLF